MKDPRMTQSRDIAGFVYGSAMFVGIGILNANMLATNGASCRRATDLAGIPSRNFFHNLNRDLLKVHLLFPHPLTPCS
jgi:hypothetical protein